MIVARLVAVDPVQHDGKLIAPGESFDVPEDAATALLACGAAIRSEGASVQAPEQQQAEPEPTRRRARSSAGGG